MIQTLAPKDTSPTDMSGLTRTPPVQQYRDLKKLAISKQSLWTCTGPPSSHTYFLKVYNSTVCTKRHISWWDPTDMSESTSTPPVQPYTGPQNVSNSYPHTII